jgi:BirA family biotin operon repressor/biotin-[acetyl-CoA-carboxylase] ligase
VSVLADGCPVYTHEVLDSTQEEARRLVEEGVQPPFWVRAEVQQQGRGRNGRIWTSTAGNLNATHVRELSAGLAVAPQLSFVAALAVYDTLASLMPAHDGRRLELKWPNDVLLAGGKIAGLLLESIQSGHGPGFILLAGFGINLSEPPSDLSRSTSALGLPLTVDTPATALALLHAALDTWLTAWDNGTGFPNIRDAWLSRAHVPGTPVSVTAGGATRSGQFVGLNVNGSLLLQTASGHIETITAGDVCLFAQAEAIA